MVLSVAVVMATGAVRLSRLPIVLPVLPPQPLVHYLDHPSFFNGAVRAVYRHSVVPGGVYSAEEVQAAMLRDPVVAAHYAKLDGSRIVGAVLEEPRAVYVSYRVGRRTGWTSRKVVLPAGERLLTDGTRAVRARCGNLVSDTAGEQGVAGASGERIDPAELDQRVAAPLVARGPEPVAAAPGLAPDVLPGAGGTPVTLGNPAAPFFVPVPGVLPFVLAGDEPVVPGDPPQPPGGPTTTTTTGIVGPPPTTTTTTTGVPPPTTTTGVIVPPPTTTTTSGVPPTTTTTTTTGVPPTTTSTTGVTPTTTTEVVVPPTTTTDGTNTTSPSTITTVSPTTFVPTTGSVPEPTRLALLVLAWAAFRYRRRPS